MTSKRPAVRINFAGKDYGLLASLQIGLLIAIAALAMSAAVMTRYSFDYHANAEAAAKRATELEARDEEIRPVLQEREQVLKDIALMSGLIELRKFSWTRLLTSVEAVFPSGAALDRISFNPKDKTLSLEGRAQSPESLSSLIIGMERSRSFRETFLKHQSLDKGTIFFTVATGYHE